MTRSHTTDQSRRAGSVILAVAVAGGVFAGGSFVAPLAAEAGSAWGGFLRLVYAPACHQLAERSLAVGQGTQAVCARCSGLYLGGVAGLVAAAWLASAGRLRPRRAWLACAAAPTVVDVLVGLVGWSALPNVPRLLVAFPAGFVAALFLAVGIRDLLAGERTSHGSPVGLGGPRALEDFDG